MKKMPTWEWSEPTNEEFDSRMKNETFFRIFWIGRNKKEHNVFKFWAKDYAAAKKVLDKYVSCNKDGREYFFDTSGYYMDEHKNRYDSLEEMLKVNRKRTKKAKNKSKKPKTQKKEKVSNGEIAYFVRHGHSKHEWWDIMWHILNDIKFNVPILIEKCHGCPTMFCEKARERIGRKDGKPKFVNPSNAEVELGMKLWKEELERFLELVYLYDFYTGYGHFDKKDPVAVRIAEKYGNTIPYIPGTNKNIDYAKLGKLTEKAWNAIWAWMKEYGQSLWD